MNVNTAIKNLKAEISTVKNENTKFNDATINTMIKDVVKDIKELESMRDYMLDLDNVGGFDYRSNMIKTINFCYEWMADINFRFSMACGGLDYEEYMKVKEHYRSEEERLKNIQI